MQSPLYDKILGMMVGCALGDALGVPFEFGSYNKFTYTGRVEHKTRLPDRFRTRYAAIGQVSDDTEMMITLATSIVNNKGYATNEVAQSYINWVATIGPFLGKNTKALFKGNSKKAISLETYVQNYTTKFPGKLPGVPSFNFIDTSQEQQLSNGALMRCSPLVLFGDNITWQDCWLTNPFPIAVDTNLVYLNSMRELLKGVDRTTIPIFALNKAQTPEVKSICQQVIGGALGRDLKKDKGLCLNGLYSALVAISKASSFEDATQWIIKDHPGSDTDTNAAIAGAMLGATFGYNNLMQSPLTAYNWNIVFNCDTTKGDLPRPDMYHPKQIPRLANDLVALLN